MASQRAPETLIARMGRKLAETIDSDSVGLTLDVTLEALNLAQEMIAEEFAARDVGTPLREKVISLVAAQAVYDLGAGFLGVQSAHWNSGSLQGNDVPLGQQSRSRLNQRNSYALSNNVLNLEWALVNQSLRCAPAPGSSLSDAIRLLVYWNPPWMHYGTVGAAPAQTAELTLGTTPTAGTVDTTNDYYNEAYVEMLTGDNAGQVKRVTNYVGSTKVCTLDSAWSLAGTSSDTYAILPFLDEHGMDTLILGALSILAVEREEDENAERFSSIYDARFEALVSRYKGRTKQRRYVNYVGPGG